MTLKMRRASRHRPVASGAIILSDDTPRIVPRFTVKIPSTRTGWMKFWSTSATGIAGVVFNANANADGFNGARTMHKLTLTDLLTPFQYSRRPARTRKYTSKNSGARCFGIEPLFSGQWAVVSGQ